jgi:hypothetical protein
LFKASFDYDLIIWDAVGFITEVLYEITIPGGEDLPAIAPGEARPLLFM